MDILKSIRLLSHFGSAQRDTSLEDIDKLESPTQLLDRLIREAKETGRKADMESVASLQGKTIQSKSAKQWEQAKQKAPNTESTMPEVQPGFVRMYHGGIPFTPGEKRWLTPDPKYAKGYASKGQSYVHYVDIDENDPNLVPMFDTSGTNMKSDYVAFEAPADLIKNMRLADRSMQNDYVANDETFNRIYKQQRTSQPLPNHENEDAAAVVAAQQQLSQPQPEPSNSSFVADTAQSVLDAVGVVDPTPISDGINTLWSLGRAFTDPERRGEHLTNAAISAVSMVPYIGDTAKLLKGGRYAKTASRLAGMGEGASAATKASQRNRYRGMVETVTGANGGSDGVADTGGGGGGGGGNVPPSNTPGSDSPDDESGGFINTIKATVDSLSAVASVAMKMTAAVAASIKGLELFNSGIVALNRDLAQYSGDMAGSFARFDADEIQRKMREAESKDGPMGLLLEEQSELKDTIDKFTNPVQSLGIALLGRATQLVNGMLIVTKFFDPVLKGIQGVADAISGNEGDNLLAIQKFFEDAQDGKLGNEPPKFNNQNPNQNPIPRQWAPRGNKI